MNKPGYDLDKIKFTTDNQTFDKAVALYENSKVTQIAEGIRAYTAIVEGSKPYHVSVEAQRYDYGTCTCYLGQNDTLCKHMVALAIYMVKDGKSLTADDKKTFQNPICSGRLGNLTENELSIAKKAITIALRYIKPYTGPSHIWFSYQNSLSEGCNRLSTIISELPISIQTAELLVYLLMRLDKKLSTGGVDDSDGAVGGFIEELVDVLQKFVELNKSCVKALVKLRNKETSFGWEKRLLNLED